MDEKKGLEGPSAVRAVNAGSASMLALDDTIGVIGRIWIIDLKSIVTSGRPGAASTAARSSTSVATSSFQSHGRSALSCRALFPTITTIHGRTAAYTLYTSSRVKRNVGGVITRRKPRTTCAL